MVTFRTMPEGIEKVLSTIDSKTFGQICDGVWRDREVILFRRGIVSGEAALVRAVYWRLCKAGVMPGKRIDECDTLHTKLTYQLVVISMLELSAHPPFDGQHFLNELVQRYQDEAAQLEVS